MSLPRLRRWGMEYYSPYGSKVLWDKYFFKFNAERKVIEMNMWAEIVKTKNRARIVDLREYS